LKRCPNLSFSGNFLLHTLRESEYYIGGLFSSFHFFFPRYTICFDSIPRCLYSYFPLKYWFPDGLPPSRVNDINSRELRTPEISLFRQERDPLSSPATWLITPDFFFFFHHRRDPAFALPSLRTFIVSPTLFELPRPPSLVPAVLF